MYDCNMAISQVESLTPRERDEFEQEKAFAELQISYQLKVKELELELARTEAGWSSLLKIPLTIVRLPVLLLFGLAYIVSRIRGQEPGDNFWNFIK